MHSVFLSTLMQEKSEKVGLVVKKSLNCDNPIVDKCYYFVTKGIKCGMVHALCQYKDTCGIIYENSKPRHLACISFTFLI